MMRSCILAIATVGLLCILNSCIDKDISKDISHEEELTQTEMPEEFTFQTAEHVQFNIRDIPGIDPVKYSIYSFGADTLNDLIVTGFTDENAQFEVQASVPDYLEKIYLVRNNNGSFKGFEIPVASGEVSFTYTDANTRQVGNHRMSEGCTEFLYAVNGDGQFFTIDNEGGSFEATDLANLEGGGSIACAVDRANRKVYYNTGTTLRYYDIETQTFHVAQSGNPFNGSYPRMEYNNSDGLLYIAKNEKMYIIDPQNNSVLSNISISGIESPVGGGDVAISLDGTVFMCTFSGLYRIEIDGVTNQATATRISAEGLPFQPTSMAIDRNDRLFLATNDANSNLIEMDKYDGAWEVVKVYDKKINDLGSLPCLLDELDQTDTDGDGINDPLDDFPNDASRAGESFTPSKYGWGSLAFEDLWPSRGDYDFNDLVVNYRFIAVANAQNKIVSLKGVFKIQAIGAGYANGFGIEFPFDPSIVTQASGSQLTEGIATVDAKGLETGQEKAVIIIFENAFKHMQGSSGTFVNTEEGVPVVTGDEFEINIDFVSPQDPETVGFAPFNPFIFINGDRGRELHLKDHTPTNKANPAFFNTEGDKSDIENGRYYLSANNLPFAIDMIHEFRYPIEKQPVNKGYNHFVEWAKSSGSLYKDWYKDNSGYRNSSFIYSR